MYWQVLVKDPFGNISIYNPAQPLGRMTIPQVAISSVLNDKLIAASQLDSGQIAIHISIDQGDPIAMTLINTPSTKSAKIDLPDFIAGTHSFKITYEFQLNNYPNDPLVIAQANITQDFSDGLTQFEIPFSELNMAFHTDNDGISNIQEILNNTNPFSAWAWLAGSKKANSVSNYGPSPGATDPSNTPGARSHFVTWVDSNNQLWLFGGNGRGMSPDGITPTGGLLNELWRGSWDMTNSTWSWVYISGSKTVDSVGNYSSLPGVTDPTNMPGSRNNAVAWIDSNDQLWLFGGWGYGDGSTPAQGYLNDLWRGTWDSVNNTFSWIWVAGRKTVDSPGNYSLVPGEVNPANTPGSRYGSVTWTDSDDQFWLFGGVGIGSTAQTQGSMNDMWRGSWDRVKNTWNWIWVSGSKTINLAGNYSSAPGEANPSNSPGARQNAISWIDSNNQQWLFGGYGYGLAADGLTPSQGLLNDLWRGSWDNTSSALSWIWVAGSKTVDSTGNYGSNPGETNPGYTPGARLGAVSWIDNNDQLWLFGGTGFDDGTGSTSVDRMLNDLWRGNWDNVNNTWNWTWVAGSKTVDSVGIYSPVPGIAELNYTPGARSGAATWADSNNQLWLFGGSGFDDSTGTGTSPIVHRLNDVWLFQP